jgi:hypothetical protein
VSVMPSLSVCIPVTSDFTSIIIEAGGGAGNTFDMQCFFCST